MTAIRVDGVTKRFGSITAVDDLSFEVLPGRVTGFLGPNGAGKSTTMRMIVGLDRPTAGTVTVNDSPYGRHRRPLHEVGALLEAGARHSGRSAYTTCCAWPRATASPDAGSTRSWKPSGSLVLPAGAPGASPSV